jgi:hypothetical protein
MADLNTQHTCALSLAQALQGKADNLAGMITTREDFCFDQDTADLIELLQSKTSTALGSNIVALMDVANQILQHCTVAQGNLDRSQQALATLQQDYQQGQMQQLKLHGLIAQLQLQTQPQQEKLSIYRYRT